MKFCKRLRSCCWIWDRVLRILDLLGASTFRRIVELSESLHFQTNDTEWVHALGVSVEI